MKADSVSEASHANTLKSSSNPQGEWRGWLRVFAQMPQSIWMMLDFVVALLSAHASIQLNVLTFERFGDTGAWIISSISAGFLIASGIAANLYTKVAQRIWRQCLASILASSLFATLAMVTAGYFLYYAVPGRLIALAFFSITLAGLFILRIPFLLLQRSLRARVFLIGTSSEYRALEALMTGPHNYELVEFWDVTTSTIDATSAQRLEQICIEKKVDEIVLSSEKGQISRWFEIVLAGARHSCRLRVLPDLIEDETKEVPIDLVDPAWILSGDLDVKNKLNEFIKRLMDLFVGGLGLIICSPIFMILGLLIKLTTNGPIFYHQIRVGRFGRTFNILKFRTMRVDAEKDGAQFAKIGDNRVTWYGGLLRKTRLDETPQFLNIFLGHMSFVGPRPERPEFVSKFDTTIPYYGCRHLMRPGLTGWAQISYRYGASAEDTKRKLQYDLFYIRHQSLNFDCYIILRTFLAIAKGAR